jgi:hypothetical protein
MVRIGPTILLHFLRLGRCSRYSSRFLFLTELYLTRPCVRNFPRPCRAHGGHARLTRKSLDSCLRRDANPYLELQI